MCSIISIVMTRSKLLTRMTVSERSMVQQGRQDDTHLLVPLKSNTLTSPVWTSTFVSPLAFAWVSMWSF